MIYVVFIWRFYSHPKFVFLLFYFFFFVMINVNSIFIWWQLIYYSIKNFFLFYIFICFINVYVFSKLRIIFLIRQHLFLLSVLYFVTSMLIYLLDVAAKLTSLLSSLLFVISAPFVVHNLLKSISLSPLIIVVSRSMTWFIAGNSSSPCGGGDWVLPILVNEYNRSWDICCCSSGVSGIISPI